MYNLLCIFDTMLAVSKVPWFYVVSLPYCCWKIGMGTPSYVYSFMMGTPSYVYTVSWWEHLIYIWEHLRMYTASRWERLPASFSTGFEKKHPENPVYVKSAPRWLAVGREWSLATYTYFLLVVETLSGDSDRMTALLHYKRHRWKEYQLLCEKKPT